MPYETEEVERMHKYFPKCPICGSEKGYGPSVFYPNVKCKSCKAEWLLYEDGMELKGKSVLGWDKTLLNEKHPLKFWKKLKRPKQKRPKKPKFVKKTYSPIFYISGHPGYKNRTIGYILLKPESIAFKTGSGSLYQMDLEIPIKQVREIGIEKTKYLVLTYENSVGAIRDLVFKPDGGAKRRIYDLVGLVKPLIRKEAMGKEMEDPLKILQIRYAKGEITKEQYEEMKKTLELDSTGLVGTEMPSIEVEPTSRPSYSTHLEKPSGLWYLVPFFFGIIGGLVGYAAVKNEDPDMATSLLICGIFMTFVAFIVLLVFYSWLFGI